MSCLFLDNILLKGLILVVYILSVRWYLNIFNLSSLISNINRLLYVLSYLNLCLLLVMFIFSLLLEFLKHLNLLSLLVVFAWRLFRLVWSLVFQTLWVFFFYTDDTVKLGLLIADLFRKVFHTLLIDFISGFVQYLSCKQKTLEREFLKDKRPFS